MDPERPGLPGERWTRPAGAGARPQPAVVVRCGMGRKMRNVRMDPLQ